MTGEEEETENEGVDQGLQEGRDPEDQDPAPHRPDDSADLVDLDPDHLVEEGGLVEVKVSR